MQTLPLHQRAAALGLAAIFTFANVSALSAFVPHEHRTPLLPAVATDAGCETNPRRPC